MSSCVSLQRLINLSILQQQSLPGKFKAPVRVCRSWFMDPGNRITSVVGGKAFISVKLCLLS